ncbi:MAG: type II toxin-antitoxin system Phd/YefM family antitoxin [Candidatus Eremiobacteraeota bacterium]|nr:type II toxin-antitoxin system Phd/YefM family antitoxin [Candidatus Eremiobacteraeota bacterium]MCW5871667.1 type II toxin-antitoxin system Phd/YefM family antitoxin [Candidatus Eremiobacteraeota bacterium]
MKIYNVHEAKTHFSAILDRVSEGEQVVIAKAGKPVAIISPHPATPPARPFGPYRGQVKVHDSFFEPMDAEFLDHFR